MVARSGTEDPGVLARHAASALAGIADDPRALVTACRRLVERLPASGPMWWLAARVLAAAEPEAEAWQAADDLRRDPTPSALAAALPESATVVLLGSPHQAGAAARRRRDLRLLAVDAAGGSGPLIDDLDDAGSDVAAVAEHGLGAAVAASSLVVLEASALGPDGLVAVSGSRAAAAVALHAGVPAWAVAGVGRVLPPGLWGALVARLRGPEPWAARQEIMPLALVDLVVGPDGPEPVDRALARAGCPDIADLALP